MNKHLVFRTRSYIRHLLKCRTAYGIHSPFVYDWYTQVLKASGSPKGIEIESLRQSLLQDQSTLSFEDLGAGSLAPVHRKIGDLVKYAARKRRSGELLSRLAGYHSFKRGLELGTHVGLGTLYLLTGTSFDKFITLEGIAPLAEKAKTHFSGFGLAPTQIVGEFGVILQQQLNLEALLPDIVFVDGNHRYQATLDYFHHILPYVKAGGVMVFDDIYWSPDMAQAWQKIVQHPDIRVSIDLFFMGICYIKLNQAKEHFHFAFWDS